MVNVVLAGGTGNVAREIIEVLLAEKKHNITVLTRKDVPSTLEPGVTTVKVDYEDKANLVDALNGAHTVLSFILDPSDPENLIEKTLIDASIEAGVKRFAPSEWSTRSDSGIPWYTPKDAAHRYLQQLNAQEKVLEYCLFQPGLFTNYFSHPYPSTKHMHIAPMKINFEHRRAIVIGDGGAVLTLTTVQDLAKVVAAAIEYEGEWPEIGGIRGGQITHAKLIELGEEIRGKPFIIERVSAEDLEKGELKTSWVPAFNHPSVPKEQHEPYAKAVVIGALLGAERGAYDVSDEWNKLLPQLKLVSIEEFLRSVWEGKP